MGKPDITPKITIEELIEHYPESNAFLIKRGLPCIVCGEPVWGNLAELAGDKKFSEDEIAHLIADLKTHLST